MPTNQVVDFSIYIIEGYLIVVKNINTCLRKNSKEK